MADFNVLSIDYGEWTPYNNVMSLVSSTLIEKENNSIFITKTRV